MWLQNVGKLARLVRGAQEAQRVKWPELGRSRGLRSERQRCCGGMAALDCQQPFAVRHEDEEREVLVAFSCLHLRRSLFSCLALPAYHKLIHRRRFSLSVLDLSSLPHLSSRSMS